METELRRTMTDTAHCPAEDRNWEKGAHQRITCTELLVPALGSCRSPMTLWGQNPNQQSCLCTSSTSAIVLLLAYMLLVSISCVCHEALGPALPAGDDSSSSSTIGQGLDSRRISKVEGLLWTRANFSMLIIYKNTLLSSQASFSS